MFIALVFGATLFSVVLSAAKKRQGHCGEDPHNCLVCNKDCTYYDLEKVA